jgi:hypothetical protein
MSERAPSWTGWTGGGGSWGNQGFLHAENARDVKFLDV